jgi:hypothetical protein
MQKRIKANLESSEAQHLIVDLKQTFDHFEVLSLTLDTTDTYFKPNANYGVIVGRVIANGGFGVPNARVSIFIPLDDADSAAIKQLYPYKTPLSKNSDGVRYNLLPNEKQFNCHVPVGTFPTKNELLDNNAWIDVYDKYYKYNAITNESGDYMIIGVPTGIQKIHMDVDLSDIGFISLRPYDLIAQGSSPNQFNGYNQFKGGKDLNVLPQVQTLDTTVDVIPFWGDSDVAVVGFTQQNFILPVDITPHAIFFGSMFTDGKAGGLNLQCRPRRKTGKNCDLTAISGEIEGIRILDENNKKIEYVGVIGQVDDKGEWIVHVPMNLDRKITSEDGSLVSSPNPLNGIPTRAKMRFRFSNTYFNYSFLNGIRKTNNFLVPNMYNRFAFGEDTNIDDFFELRWKKLYSVKQFIPNYFVLQDLNLPFINSNNYLSIKDIGDCDYNYPVPYNRLDTNPNIIYTVLATIINVIRVITNAINSLIPGSGNDIKLDCNGEELEPDEWRDCTLLNLATSLGVIKYNFNNDWLTGALYAPLTTFKQQRVNGVIRFERYCDFDCREKANTQQNDVNYRNRCPKSYIGEGFNNNNNGSLIVPPVNRGIVYKEKESGIFYYASRYDIVAGLDGPSVELETEEKYKLLLATNLVELGSITDCDIEGVPYIIRELDATTYREDEDGNLLFALGVNVPPNSINRNASVLISQTNVDVISSFYGYDLQNGPYPEADFPNSIFTDRVVFDRPSPYIRRYLCETQNYFKKNFNYTEIQYAGDGSAGSDGSPGPRIEEDNEPVPFTIDKCNCEYLPDDNLPMYKKVTPYYMYFGLNKGNNSYDRLIKNYFKNC